MKAAMLFLGLHDVGVIGGCYTCDVGAPDANGNVTGQVYLLRFGGTTLRLCSDCLDELRWLIAPENQRVSLPGARGEAQ